ncbi:hypothetical protein [Burkholderia gladioli]|uniref:hypothetical protein n=1 Tax=Burkholderia gladioli TaxID=28095 RepID=UPI0013F5C38E|nr:hypothetical protein [Burkholderia gladioli]
MVGELVVSVAEQTEPSREPLELFSECLAQRFMTVIQMCRFHDLLQRPQHIEQHDLAAFEPRRIDVIELLDAYRVCRSLPRGQRTRQIGVHRAQEGGLARAARSVDEMNQSAARWITFCIRRLPRRVGMDALACLAQRFGNIAPQVFVNLSMHQIRGFDSGNTVVVIELDDDLAHF